MSSNKPEFRLETLWSDGSRGEPELVPVTKIPWSSGMDRRGALGAGLGFAGVLAAMQTKASAEEATCVVPKATLKAHKGYIRALSISMAGDLLVSAGGSDTKAWSLKSANLLHAMRDMPFGLFLTSDGRELVTGRRDGTVGLWSLADERLDSIVPKTWESVVSFTLTPDGKIVAVGTTDNAIHLWSLPQKRLLTTLKAHPQTATSVAGTWDGKYLASGYRDGILKVWSLLDGSEVASAQGHDDSVDQIAIAPDGRFLATAGAGMIITWSLPNLEPLSSKTEEGKHTSVLVTLDNERFASGKESGEITIWSFSPLQVVDTIQCESVSALAATRDGQQLAVGTNDGAVFLVDLTRKLAPHCVKTYFFDPKVSLSTQKGVSYRIYDKITGKTVTTTLPCGSPIPSGAICTCNCVPGSIPVSAPVPPRPSYSSGGTYCQCNKICTCVPVPSSRRWKQNIRPLSEALGQVEKLQAVRFDWTSQAPQSRHGSDLGFIAEEVANVVPEVVFRDGDGNPQAVDYSRLTALLVEAVKTQQHQIEELQERLSQLTCRQEMTDECTSGLVRAPLIDGKENTE